MKKTTTRKGTAKSTGTSTTLTTLEKNFRSTPAKIIAQYRKQIAGTKQQQKKLEVALKKAQTQKQTTTKTIATLGTKKPSATTKKQISKHTKTLGTTGKTITGLTKQLTQLKQTTAGFTHGAGKYTQLVKQLSALDKEWKAKAQTATTGKTKTTGTKSKTRTTDTTKTGSTSPYGSTNTQTYGNNTVSDDEETEKTG